MGSLDYTVDADAQLEAAIEAMRRGGDVIIRVDGEPAARLVSVPASRGERHRRHRALIARLRRQKSVVVAPWTRDDVYDECV